MLKYIILGIIQGITEFLPVSSSAHLVIMQKILGITGQEVALTIVLHLGTAFALVIFFFQDILQVMRSLKSLALIAMVTLLTGIIGLSGKDFFEGLFSSPKLAAVALIFTGITLFLTKKFMDGKRGAVNIKDACILGITQGVAIIPGISRSGITVSTLLFRGVNRKISFKFSFLASIPAVFAAAILEAEDIGVAIKGDFKNFTLGFMVSLLSGILSLWILKVILNKSKLYYFGYYCIGVGIITLLLM